MVKARHSSTHFLQISWNPILAQLADIVPANYRGKFIKAAGNAYGKKSLDSGSAVLIIEDDPDVAELLAATLRRVGYRTVIADDGEGGVVAARDSDVGLILLDLRLPGIDGFDVLRQLRGESVRPTVPVIAITGTPASARRCSAAKAAGSIAPSRVSVSSLSVSKPRSAARRAGASSASGRSRSAGSWA